MRTTKLLAALLALGLVLAACGDDGDTTTAGQTSTTGAASSSTTAGADYGSGGTTATTTATANGEATVAVANDAELGDYLVGPDGRTLYLFEKDQGTTTACTGGCADSWPPLVAQGGAPKAGDGVDAGELSTADGIEPDQVTYHGHLLYYFAGDQAAGDTNGTSVPAWYAVGPDGEAIGEG